MRRVFERKGLALRPLAGPEIPLPGEQDEQLRARWEAWRAIYFGSLPEFIVWEWLKNKKRQVEGRDFIYQWSVFGGRTAFGGFVLDFYFPARALGWMVQGLRYHLTNPDDRSRNQVAKQILAAQELTVIEIWEDDLMTRPDFVLELAWQGQAASLARSRQA